MVIIVDAAPDGDACGDGCGGGDGDDGKVMIKEKRREEDVNVNDNDDGEPKRENEKAIMEAKTDKRKRVMRMRNERRTRTRTVVAVAAAEAAAASRGGTELGKEGERAGGRQEGRQARGALTLTHSHTVAPSVDPHVGHPFPKPSQGGGTWLAQALHGSLPPAPLNCCSSSLRCVPTSPQRHCLFPA